MSLDAVVELGSSTQQQVDASAEGGVGRQEDCSLPALLLCPHPTQELPEDTRVQGQKLHDATLGPSTAVLNNAANHKILPQYSYTQL